MLAIFVLQVLHELSEGALLFSHNIGNEERIENPVPFWEMARNADSARFFSADQNLALQHEIADVLEPYAALVQLASVLGGDAVEHLRRIERAHYFARPLLAFQQPAQQD